MDDGILAKLERRGLAVRTGTQSGTVIAVEGKGIDHTSPPLQVATIVRKGSGQFVAMGKGLDGDEALDVAVANLIRSDLGVEYEEGRAVVKAVGFRRECVGADGKVIESGEGDTLEDSAIDLRRKLFARF